MSEKLHERIVVLQEQLRQGNITRRDFLRYATLLGLSVGAAEALTACAPAAAPTSAPTTAPPSAPTTAPPEAPTTAPSAPPPTAEPAAPAPVAQGVPFPGYAWTPPYAGIHVDFDRCNGCRICEGACSIKNFGEFNPELSRIKIDEYYGGIVLVPSICWGCQWQGGSANGGLDAPCLAACPTDPKAISWHESLNIPVVDEDICIRCGLCYEACAPRAMKENPVTGFPNVCTRCDGDPECIKQCPVQALQPQKRASGIEYCYGTMTTEAIAKDLIEHKFYPWVGMEDWKKVGV